MAGCGGRIIPPRPCGCRPLGRSAPPSKDASTWHAWRQAGWRQIPLTPATVPAASNCSSPVNKLFGRAAHPTQSAAFAGAVDHAHNDYLEMLVELGPVGLCAFLALLGGIVWRSRRIQDDAFALGAWGGAAGAGGGGAGRLSFLSPGGMDTAVVVSGSPRPD